MAKARKSVRPKSKAQTQPVISPVIIGGVALAAILVVAGLILLGNQARGVGGPVDVSQFPTLGDADAPVTIVEYSDYGCGHCRDFVLEKFDRLKADYVDTGKAKYVVHSFNLGNPQMALAAEAAWCAQDQGEFFNYHHALFENQGVMAINQSTLTDLAASIGLDGDAFSACLSNRTHQADVENARRAAANRGIHRTPTFFVDNQRTEGNQPYEIFQRMIEQELATAQ